MKRLILSLLILLSANIALHSAITATIGTVTATTGQTVSIPVTLSGANGSDVFWGCELLFNYDNTKISTSGGQFASYSSVLPSSNWLGNMNYSSSKIFNSYENGSVSNNVSVPDATVIFNIQVTYTGSTPTTITWDQVNSFFFNTSLATLSVTWVNGGINPASTAPAVPTLLLPLDLSTDIPLNPTLSWNTAANATGYRYQLSTSSTFATTLYDAEIAGTSIQLSGLTNNTNYFWRVCSKNGTVYSNWSDTLSFTTIFPVLTAPILSSPANASTNVSITPTLSWGAVTTATGYQLQVSTSSTFVNTLLDESQTGTSKTLAGLSNNTTYYWRVKAVRNTESSNWSNSWSLTTVLPVLTAPILTSPANAITNVSLTPALSWGSVSTATSYQLQVSTSSTFASIFLDETLTGTSKALAGLSNSTQYYWRVRTVRNSENSGWSNAWSFTTLASISAPSLVSPINSAINVAISPTLSWSTVSTATSYQFQVSVSSSFTTLLSNETIPDVSYALNGLSYSTIYYWRVRALKNSEVSEWSSVRNFQTIAMVAPPTLIIPSNNATNISINPTLTWNSATTATGYQVQLSTTSTFSNIIEDESLTGTSFQAPNLNHSSTYYWRVRSIRDSEMSAWSGVYSFTTFSVLTVPTLISPTHTTINAALNQTLTWNPIATATGYNIQVATTSSFFVTIKNETLTTTNFNLTGLNYSTIYFWRVRSIRDSEMSEWSSAWSFYTFSVLNPPVLSSPINSASSISINPTITWVPDPTAVNYTLQISTTSSFSTIIRNQIVTSANSMITGLNNNTQYYWRVRTHRASENSDWSSVWSFTTIPPAPVIPILLLPLNNSTNIALNSSLSWQASAFANSYNVQVSTSNNFSTNVMSFNRSEPNLPLSGLVYNKTYYWRVFASNDIGTSAWSETRSFKTIAMPLSWAVAGQTGYSSTIGFKPTGTFKIGLRSVDIGDAIGVFFIRNNQEVCGGNLVWDGVQYGMVVWGDDNQTLAIEGFLAQEPYIFKVWDAQTQTEYAADVLLESGLTYYTNNGLTVVEFLEAKVNQTHPIHFNRGWNMVSTYINPINDSLSALASQVANSALQVKSSSGDMYWPPFTASLTNWNKYQAYQVYMYNRDSIKFTGSKIIPESTPINLSYQGWNWVPYFRTSTMPIAQALATVASKYGQVKTITGQVYWLPYLQTLTHLTPGIGYMVKMNFPAVLTYPANSAIKSAEGTAPIIHNPKVFVRENHVTGSNSVVALEIDRMEAGDEVAAFTADGKLVGSAVWGEGSKGMVIWGDDIMTPEIDGACEGETIYLKAWTKTNDNISDILTNNVENIDINNFSSSIVYKTDGTYLVSAQIAEQPVQKINVYPQPAVNEVFANIRNSDNNQANFKIYNQIGEEIFSGIETLSNGIIRINTSSMQSGVYQISINVNDETYIERIVIAK